jgi:carbamoyl-phosphate synthase large subunit
MTSMDPWFLYHIKEITDTIARVGEQTPEELSPEL